MKLFDPLREEMIEVDKSGKIIKRKKIKEDNTFEINRCKIFSFGKEFVKKLNERCINERNK